MAFLIFIFRLNYSYVTEACSHGFQCLYDNVGGAVELMGNFWRFVASTFNSYSNLLGLVSYLGRDQINNSRSSSYYSKCSGQLFR
jgi:hypothetical protein